MCVQHGSTSIYASIGSHVSACRVNHSMSAWYFGVGDASIACDIEWMCKSSKRRIWNLTQLLVLSTPLAWLGCGSPHEQGEGAGSSSGAANAGAVASASSVGSGAAGTGGLGPTAAGSAAAGIADLEAAGAGGWMKVAPTLNPELIVLSYVGGQGDQYLERVEFSAAGDISASAAGFAVKYDARAFTGSVSGDIASAMDITKFPVNFPLPKGGLSTNKYTDVRNGQTYTWGTHPNVAHGGTICPDQCNGLCKPGDTVAAFLQMAFVTSDKGWKLWDFTWDSCVSACEVADSRGYDLWPSANGKVGAMLWTDGGDTPLRHDPLDVAKPASFLKGAFGDSPGGRGVLFALIDPETGHVDSGTFLNTHAVFHAQDEWGRVYISKSVPIRYGASPLPQPTNPWAQSNTAETGLFVLNSQFNQPEFHAYLGGNKASCANPDTGIQLFNAIALRGNLLVMAGTTCVTDLPTTANAVQKTSGGGQDGFFAIIKLW